MTSGSGNRPTMRLTKLPLATRKEAPADAEVASHRLMLRAGMLRRLASGLYSWLPLGMRVVHKVARVVREEMDRAGALEVLMPSVQPAELWRESGRWEEYGPELLRFRDRHQRDFCYGPTHEEVITDIARRELHSYRQLPVNYYQIQTKFRDEIRPRFGVIRAREFIMKDAYSFHLDEASLEDGYREMYDAYSRIFTRLGLEFRAVHADSGAIGGHKSQEFHVLADSGEDAIAFSDGDDYAANVELAGTLPPAGRRPAPEQACEVVETPDVRTMDELTGFLGVPASGCVKTLLVDGENSDLVALVVRGDHQPNAFKAARLEGVANPLSMAAAARIHEVVGTEPGFVGPVGLDVRTYADHSAAHLADFVCGANAADRHLTGVNWGRDASEPVAVDIRNVVAGDPSPRGKGTLAIARGIEVGHIFQLGRKYSDAMDARVVDENGKRLAMHMGCYGIGVTRIVAAAIEQNHDDRGIIWPEPIAPYEAVVIPINMEKSARVRDAAEGLYRELVEAGVEVLLDDRAARPGVKFADADLIGIPHRLVVAERGLDAGTLEYKHRRDAEAANIPRQGLLDFLGERRQRD